MSAADLKPGASVRHPSRGIGTVSTVVFSPLTHRPIKAWCEFPVRSWTQKYCCFVDDLTVVPAPAVAPVLRVIAPHVAEIVA